MAQRRRVLIVVAAFGLVLSIVLVAVVVRSRPKPSRDTRPMRSSTADATTPNPSGRYFHSKNYGVIVEHLREDMKSDPTLAASLLSVTRETVMGLEHLSRKEREDLWEHIQKLQAEARSHPAQPIVEVSDE